MGTYSKWLRCRAHRVPRIKRKQVELPGCPVHRAACRTARRLRPTGRPPVHRARDERHPDSPP